MCFEPNFFICVGWVTGPLQEAATKRTCYAQFQLQRREPSTEWQCLSIHFRWNKKAQNWAIIVSYMLMIIALYVASFN
jgi:hypothetical protein